MINLLSNKTKNELAAARRNIVLLKYVITLLAVAGIATLSYFGAYCVLDSQARGYRQEAATYQPQRTQYSDVIKAANSYNKDLSIAKSILKNEFHFSELLIEIARILPSGTVLTTIDTNNTNLQKPFELQLDAKSYQDALSAKEAFQKSAYFKDAKLQSITQIPESTYPYQTVLTVTFDYASFMKAQKEKTP